MNSHFPAVSSPEMVRLSVEDFLMLRRAGVFDAFSKSELLEGALFGVLRPPEGEPETDFLAPIRLRQEDYARLDREGAFAAFGKTELVDGRIYGMNPQHRPHGFIKDELAYRLRRCLEEIGSPLHVATEQSVDLTTYSEPQPDIILTREPRGMGAIPGPSIALIVEVSISTLAFDLGEKARIYAQAGIPEYWIVDAAAKRVRQCWTPRDNVYNDYRDIPFAERIEAFTLTGLGVELRDFA